MSEGENNKYSHSYEYINVDSVLWLKYFKPLGNSPAISSFTGGNTTDMIRVNITNEQGESVVVELEQLTNRNDGLKVNEEYKSKLKSFCGSHGDKRKYIISII